MTKKAELYSTVCAPPPIDDGAKSQKRPMDDLRPEGPILKGGDQLLRLDQIIGPKGFVPLSRSTWYSLIAQGRIKKPTMLGKRIACYWKSDVLAFIAESEISNGQA